MHWQKVTLIGVGLLGGSLGLAIKQRGLAKSVVGFVRRAAAIEECQRAGVVDQATGVLLKAVADADLVIFCTPIARMAGLCEQMLPALAPGALVTDVGSVKGPVVQALEPLAARANAHFVGSHPMAGAEKMGVQAARADLFEGAICVVTPTPRTRLTTTDQIEQFWSRLGALPLRLAPELHDELVSRSSHLPHVVAAELANYVLDPAHPPEQVMLCASGFRDTTRIASSSPEMWRDIALANRENLARVLGVFLDDMSKFHHALDQGDGAAILEFFARAKQQRDQWKQPPAPSLHL